MTGKIDVGQFLDQDLMISKSNSFIVRPDESKLYYIAWSVNKICEFLEDSYRALLRSLLNGLRDVDSS